MGVTSVIDLHDPAGFGLDEHRAIVDDDIAVLDFRNVLEGVELDGIRQG